VCSGAGAAALAPSTCCVARHPQGEHLGVHIMGVVYEGRTEEMDDNKIRYAQRRRRGPEGIPRAATSHRLSGRR
jgi:malic enzyme